MRPGKRLIGTVCLLSLSVSIPAYAVTVVPPPPIESQGGDQESQAGPGTEQPRQPESGAEPSGQSGPAQEPQQSQESGQANEPQQSPESGQAQETPEKPEIKAQGAVLLDASTGALLFEKNADTRYYPASITKLMTALLVAENCSLSDTVTFSAAATTNLESGSVTLNLTEGDQLSVEQCLYGLLLKSANEVANALAEHVSGSVSGFADLMNQKAASLGCTNTHFANPNGLNSSQHYTTPKDMALIARAAFSNETVCRVSSTLTYQMPATKKAGARTITMGHKMINPSDARYYPGVIGGKTGYTSLAGNTLVTCAQRDGVRLIAVVMKSKSTHYKDTAALLDYGFQTAQTSQPGALAGKWVEDHSKWRYIKADGSRAANEWLTLDGEDYWFDSDAFMAVGWRQYSNGAWYYFKSSGAMARSRWVENNGKWFYLGADGVMLTNTVTPDGYQVGASGEWLK